MKKFASIFMSLLLTMTVVVSAFSTTSAATNTEIDFNQKAQIVLNKYDDNDPGLEDDKPVSGATFTAYKIFSLVKDATTDTDSLGYGSFQVETPYANIEVRDGVSIAEDLLNTVRGTGNDDSKGGFIASTDELEAVIREIEQVIIDSRIAGNEITGTDSVEVETGKYEINDLDLGIYLVLETVCPDNYVISSQPCLVMLPEWDNTNSWQYTVTANPKDTPIDIEKDVNDFDKDNVEIGKVVKFTTDSDIPNYGYTNISENDATYKLLTSVIKDEEFNAIQYDFNDTATAGLTFLKDMNVDIVDADGNVIKTLAAAATKDDLVQRVGNATNNKTGEYFVNFTSDRSFELNVAWYALDQYQANDYDVKLTYHAVVNKDAYVKNTELNTVTLTYDTDPDHDPDDPDYDPETIDDDATLYSYELDLTKTFNNAAPTADVDATMVTFELYRGDDNAGLKDQVSFIKIADGHYVAWNQDANVEVNDNMSAYEKLVAELSTRKYEEVKAILVTEINCAADGSLVIDGLDAFNENDPNGFDGNYTLKEVASDSNYAVLTDPVTFKITAEVKNGVLTSALKNASHFAYNGSKAVESDLTIVKDGENNTHVFEMTINNIKKQFNLPLTGGLGLWMFTIAGGVVMAGVIIFFSAIRKKESK